MKLSIRTRLSVAFSLIFTLLIIFFSGTIYYFMSSDLERELAEDSAHDIKEVLHVFTHGTWEEQLAEMPEESREFSLTIRVIDDQGKIIYLTKGAEEWTWDVDLPVLKEALAKPVWTNEVINETSHLVLTQTFIPKARPPHFLQVANSRADINRIRQRLIFCINIGTPFILFIAILMGRFFAKWALAPVEMIRQRAQAITSDNLQERLVYHGPPDELHRLTDTLNNLLGRVQLTLDQMKHFIADASHELRIPLTGIRGLLEVSLRQERSKEEYKHTIESAYHESERLSELVWDLLSLARVDAGEMKLEKAQVFLPTFLQAVFEEAESLNVEKKATIRLGNLPVGKAVFDEAKTHQLLINLIENAIRYNNPGGEIVLSAELKKDIVVISVKDNGIGIAPEDQAKIFERFYRVDKARSREAGGTGLGLPIARAIAEAHKGTLTVQSALGKGSEFILTLPVEL